MSDRIDLTGIRGFGFHGVFEEERVNGQEFIVDLSI
jgi:dihydroneopterin aldolase